MMALAWSIQDGKNPLSCSSSAGSDEFLGRHPPTSWSEGATFDSAARETPAKRQFY
jgi:hypothetical protein